MARMTLDEAKVVLAQHGIVVMPKSEHAEMCANAAAAIAAQADLDRDFQALFGRLP
jgi:hypothetical protein